MTERGLNGLRQRAVDLAAMSKGARQTCDVPLNANAKSMVRYSRLEPMDPTPMHETKRSLVHKRKRAEWGGGAVAHFWVWFSHRAGSLRFLVFLEVFLRVNLRNFFCCLFACSCTTTHNLPCTKLCTSWDTRSTQSWLPPVTPNWHAGSTWGHSNLYLRAKNHAVTSFGVKIYFFA